MNDEDEYDEFEDWGSCDECGGDLMDENEAWDGICDQCAWWIEQASRGEQP